jgi:hypothetical protein
MALTQLQSATDNVKVVKVRITKDTVINMNGKTGVPVYTGSVLNVSPENAALLFASIKATRAKPDDEEIVHYKPVLKPDAAKGELQKAGK